jgi:hypothetical protein
MWLQAVYKIRNAEIIGAAQFAEQFFADRANIVDEF